MSKACPVPGCGWTITEGAVMCADHWQMLPSRLQRDLRNAKTSHGSVLQRQRLQQQVQEHLQALPL